MSTVTSQLSYPERKKRLELKAQIEIAEAERVNAEEIRKKEAKLEEANNRLLQIEEQISEFEDKPADELTDADERTLRRLRRSLNSAATEKALHEKSITRLKEDLENTRSLITNALSGKLELLELDAKEEDLQKNFDADEQVRLNEWEERHSDNQYHYRCPTPSVRSKSPLRNPQHDGSSAKTFPVDRRGRLTNTSEMMNKQEAETVSTSEKLLQQLVQHQLKGRMGTLPKFDGDPADWNKFREAFYSANEEYDLSQQEQLQRLEVSLKGEPQRMVKHLFCSSNNVKKIMGILHSTYGRSEFVLLHMVEEVKSCKPPDPNKPETVVNFGVAVDALVTNAESYGRADYLNNSILLLEIVKKMAPQMQISWNKWRYQRGLEDEVTLLAFSHWLQNEVGAARFAVIPKAKTSDQQNEEKGHGRKRGPAGKLNAAAGKEKHLCPACKKEDHDLSSCETFLQKSVNDKWKIVKEDRRCFLCLKFGHQSGKCFRKERCGFNDCKVRHHKLLHLNFKRGKRQVPPVEVAADDLTPEAEQENEAENAGGKSGSAVKMTGSDLGTLAIVPIRLRGPKGVIKTYALLDSGADCTMLEQPTANKIAVKGPSSDFRVIGMGGHTETHVSQCVNFEISGTFPGARFYKLNKVRTIRTIGQQPYSLDVEKLKQLWPHLQKARGESLVRVVPTIIIGGDYPALQIHREYIEGPPDSPVAVRTRLGWVIAGRLRCLAGGRINSVQTDNQLHDMIKEHFSLENFGVVNRSIRSVEDRKSLQLLENLTVRCQNGWTTGLLWKLECQNLPESKHAAENRLRGIERKMQKDSVFAQLYCKKFEEYMKKGYITKLNETDDAAAHPRIWYIPHFGVTNVNKPGKIRLVFDAAAKSHGVSLNDNLMTGPDLMASLPAVLLNFRRHPVVINGDIEDMFHRVFVRKQDRPGQRFLWRDGDMSRSPDVYEMNVLIFGATSSPTSAIYCRNRNAADFREKYPEAYRVITEDFFVDDCLTGAKTSLEAIELRKQLQEVNEAGNFQVKKWTSNDPAVLASIPEDLRAQGIKEMKNKTTIPTGRVLGMWWNPETDQFTFQTNFSKVPAKILQGARPTKRQLCSLVMSLFDPLGIVANFRVTGLILVQATWKSEINWDDEIPDEIYTDWKEWVREIPEITKVKVSRCFSYKLADSASVQLHVFVDASEEAYAAVAYLRVNEFPAVEVSFAIAKIKVAPKKKLTIPRLELQAAVLGARIAHTLKKELKVNWNSLTLWSDSTTVLNWIRSESGQWKEFVANRISEIQELTDLPSWRWVPTDDNPADFATHRGGHLQIEEGNIWLCGPQFLQRSGADWPKDFPDKANNSEATVELTSQGEPKRDKLRFNIERYSSYRRLLNCATGVVLAVGFWLSKWRKLAGIPPWNRIGKKEISPLLHNVEASEKAERLLLQQAQLEMFEGEIKRLKEKKPVKKDSKILKLNPFLDADGLLKMNGRIEAADLPIGVKNPIILDNQHHFTKLIIFEEHKRCGHVGEATVLCNLRQRFWILKGRAAVKSCFSNCWDCKIRKVQPVPQQMAPLPLCRLDAGKPPFFHCGVDYFGPLQVTVGRHREKRWGALFTCLVTRAVHIELVPALSTDEFLMALSRMISCRGSPQFMYSDHGTNFVGAARELREAAEKPDWKNEIVPATHSVPIQWEFITVGAPNQGGAWESMVKCVKRALYTTLKEKVPHDTTLLTALKAAEDIINSRPLTYLFADASDENPLTPNHILRGRPSIGPTFPGVQITDGDELCRKKYRIVQSYVDQFWKRWVKEFLPNLVNREKWWQQQKPVELGEVVLVVDDQEPRNLWRKAVVTKLLPGKDNLVRNVEITLSDFESHRKTTFTRAVNRLCRIGLTMGIQGQVELVPKSGAGVVNGMSLNPEVCVATANKG